VSDDEEDPSMTSIEDEETPRTTIVVNKEAVRRVSIRGHDIGNATLIKYMDDVSHHEEEYDTPDLTAEMNVYDEAWDGTLECEQGRASPPRYMSFAPIWLQKLRYACGEDPITLAERFEADQALRKARLSRERRRKSQQDNSATMTPISGRYGLMKGGPTHPEIEGTRQGSMYLLTDMLTDDEDTRESSEDTLTDESGDDFKENLFENAMRMSYARSNSIRSLHSGRIQFLPNPLRTPGGLSAIDVDKEGSSERTSEVRRLNRRTGNEAEVVRPVLVRKSKMEQVD
jgi:hypothetical protein